MVATPLTQRSHEDSGRLPDESGVLSARGSRRLRTAASEARGERTASRAEPEPADGGATEATARLEAIQDRLLAASSAALREPLGSGLAPTRPAGSTLLLAVVVGTLLGICLLTALASA